MEKRYSSIDVAKGMGIIQVVIGHYSPSYAPAYWVKMVAVIYTFHMPLFMLLSGYLHASSRDYDFGISLAFAEKKFKRLMIPFLSITLGFFAIKMIAAMFVQLQYPATWSGLFRIFTTKDQSFMPLLWFVYALFGIFLVYTALQRCGASSMTIFTASVFLALVPWPDIFYLKQIFTNFPFFAFGCVVRPVDFDMLKYRQYWIVMLGALFMLTTHFAFVSAASRFIALAAGILGSGVVLASSSLIAPLRLSVAISIAGRCSMSIYLFHTLFSGFVRVLCSQRLHIAQGFYLSVAIAAIAAGIVCPLLIETYALKRWRVLRICILGLPT